MSTTSTPSTATPADVPPRPETFISVDVESAGPVPSRFALLSIGACLVEAPATTFYVELQPDRDEVDKRALAIHHLDPTVLAVDGVEPGLALQRFADWVADVVPEGHVPVFVAFNAPFDWMFVDDYFQRYLGANPFGHSALDIKSYALALDDGAGWAGTSMRVLSPKYLTGRPLAHNALNDAQDQAELFRALRADNARRA